MIGKVILTTGAVSAVAHPDPPAPCANIQIEDWSVDKDKYSDCTACVADPNHRPGHHHPHIPDDAKDYVKFEACGGSRACDGIKLMDWDTPVAREQNLDCTKCVQNISDDVGDYQTSDHFKACGGILPCDKDDHGKVMNFPQALNDYPAGSAEEECNNCLLYYPFTGRDLDKRGWNFNQHCGGNLPREDVCDGLTQEHMFQKEECGACVRLNTGSNSDMDFAFIVPCGGKPFPRSCRGWDYANYSDEMQCVMCLTYWGNKPHAKSDEDNFINKCGGMPFTNHDEHPSCANTTFYNSKSSKPVEIWQKNSQCENCVDFYKHYDNGRFYYFPQDFDNRNNLEVFLQECGGQVQSDVCNGVSWTDWSDMGPGDPDPNPDCTTCVLKYNNETGNSMNTTFELCGGSLSCRGEGYCMRNPLDPASEYKTCEDNTDECKKCTKHFSDDGIQNDPDSFAEDCGGEQPQKGDCYDFDWESDWAQQQTGDQCPSCVHWWRDHLVGSGDDSDSTTLRVGTDGEDSHTTTSKVAVVNKLKKAAGDNFDKYEELVFNVLCTGIPKQHACQDVAYADTIKFFDDDDNIDAATIQCEYCISFYGGQKYLTAKEAYKSEDCGGTDAGDSDQSQTEN